MGITVAVCVAAGVLLGIWLDSVREDLAALPLRGPRGRAASWRGLIVVSLVRRKL